VPQVEVTFDIDANGILNVSAKDKATGKEQSIIIKASSGLSDEEIDKMVKDAEAHADEDKRMRELVDARNQAENMIHATEKSVKELGDKLEDGEQQEIDDAIAALRKAIEGDDKAEIEAKTEALAERSGKLAERVYKQQAESESAGVPGAG
jgi:molecular chaperone DnaK